MKTLNNIKADMSELYDELRGGKIEIKAADTLVNVAGKNLKAYQLDLAEQIFLSGQPKKLPSK